MRRSIRPHSLHVVAGLDPVYGGPTYAVAGLRTALANAGAPARIVTVAEPGAHVLDEAPGVVEAHAQDFATVPGLRSLRFSRGLDGALRNDVTGFDLIHSHGLWLAPNLQAARWARRTRRPLVTTVHGMLTRAALDRSKWRKAALWRLGQRSALAQAACIHVTGLPEYDDVRRSGLSSPVAIIPNGVDVPALPAARRAKSSCVLFLGRLHPHKGLDDLLAAWARVGPSRDSWRLRLIGPDPDRYSGHLQKLAVQLGAKRISFEQPVSGADKIQVLRDADVLVLPSASENFGLAVAEALAVGRPAIATQGAPWQGLAQQRCGWWIERGVDALEAALADAMSRSEDELDAMGARGRAWVERDFGWPAVSQKMIATYAWITAGGERPEHVLVD